MHCMLMAEGQVQTRRVAPLPCWSALPQEVCPDTDKGNVGTSPGDLSPCSQPSTPPGGAEPSSGPGISSSGGPFAQLYAGCGRGPAGDHSVGQVNLLCDFQTYFEQFSVASFHWFLFCFVSFFSRKSDLIMSSLKSERNLALRCQTWLLLSQIMLTWLMPVRSTWSTLNTWF